MINFSVNTQIYRPLHQVFAFVATPENDFQWQYGTLDSAQISEGTIGVGAYFRSVGHFMGQRVESTFQVTDYEPNKKYGFRSLTGPIQVQTLFTFEMTSGSTRVSVTTRATPRDAFEENSAIVEKKVRKQYKENLAILKDVLESH